MSGSPKDREKRTIDALIAIQNKRAWDVPPVILALPDVRPRAPAAHNPAWWRLRLEHPTRTRDVIVRAESFDDALRHAKTIFGSSKWVSGEKLRSALGEPF